MALGKYDIESLIKTYAKEVARAQAQFSQTASYSIASPRPADYAPLAESIGEAIRDGLGSIATAIEYVGQLEDSRERESARQLEDARERERNSR